MKNTFIRIFRSPADLIWEWSFTKSEKVVHGNAEWTSADPHDIFLIDYNKDAMLNSMYNYLYSTNQVTDMTTFVLKGSLSARLILITILNYLNDMRDGRLEVTLKRNGVQYYYILKDVRTGKDNLLLGISNGHIIIFDGTLKNSDESKNGFGVNILRNTAFGDVTYLDNNFSIEYIQETDQSRYNLYTLLNELLLIHKSTQIHDSSNAMISRIDEQMLTEYGKSHSLPDNVNVCFCDKMSPNLELVLTALMLIRPEEKKNIPPDGNFVDVEITYDDKDKRKSGPSGDAADGQNDNGLHSDGKAADASYESQLRKIRLNDAVDKASDVITSGKGASIFSLALALADQLVETGNDVADKRGVFAGHKSNPAAEKQSTVDNKTVRDKPQNEDDENHKQSRSLIGKSLEVFFS